MQRQLRVEREAHAIRVEAVELRIAEEDVFRVLQAGRAAVSHGVGHPVDALEDALPVEQGRGQDQIGLGLKVAKDRPLGEPGAQRDVCDLGLFDPVGQKTVQRDLRDQTDILFSLLLVRQVRSPPLRFVSFADRCSVLRKAKNVKPLTERAGNKNCAAQHSERHIAARPKPRRVSPPQRRKKVRSFSSATCAAKKILLGLQTCAPSAESGWRVRCSQAAGPFVKKAVLF